MLETIDMTNTDERRNRPLSRTDFIVVCMENMVIQDMIGIQETHNQDFAGIGSGDSMKCIKTIDKMNMYDTLLCKSCSW